MSKFKMHMKLEGFELDIEGNREDAKLIAESVGQQVSATILPAVTVIDGNLAQPKGVTESATVVEPPKPKSRRKQHTKSSNGTPKVDPLDLNHDPKAHGTPQQSWSLLDKAMWIIFVMKHQMSVDGLTQPEIVATFQKHFRESKGIYAPRLGRSLLDAKKKGLVSEDTNGEEHKWHLLDNGSEHVRALIDEQRAA